MHFKMPYVFKALVKPPGKRNAVSLDFGGHLDLDLQEADGEDAPTVVDWTRRTPHNRQGEAMTGRFRGGMFYAAVTNDDGSYLRAADLTAADIYTFPHVGPWSEPKPIDLFNAGRLTHSVGDYRECQSSSEEEVIENVRKAASEFLIVEGLVYRPHPVPVIKTSLENYRDSSTLRLSVEYDVELKSNMLHFHIHEIEAALAWADEVVGSSHIPMSVVNEVEAVVYRPELLPDIDLFVIDLRKTLDIALESAGKTLHVMPDDYIDAWQTLRRSRNALFEGCPEEVGDAAMRAWTGFLDAHDAVEEEKHRRWGREYNPDSETERQMYNFFLPRWEGHDIKFDIGQGFSPITAI
jgi:hypothetical protein|nr:hypothetical protein [Neorhizobium tomejilense]